MMAQYADLKRAHPGCLLFFRLGDFYEMFFEDAAVAAPALDLTLTRRGRAGDADVPMCGVPAHAADGYLARLIRLGHRVAICEQVEDPGEAKKRGGKILLRRQVIRVVTPGTLTEDSLLDARANNFLACLGEAEGALALAWLDLSTGGFTVESIARPSLAAAVARIAPGELLVSRRLAEDPDLAFLRHELGGRLTIEAAAELNSTAGRRRLESLYGIGSLDGFGAFAPAELAAAGAVVAYIELTQKGLIPRLRPLRRIESGATLEIDAATRVNLELERSLGGTRTGSLLGAIDRTLTGAGARLLATRLAAPLTDPLAIERRLDMVAFFAAASARRGEIRTAFRGMADLERALGRLMLGRGGPRDLAAIADALGRVPAIRGMLAPEDLVTPPEGVSAEGERLDPHDWLVDRLGRALLPDLPLLARDGNFIAPGFAPEIDELRSLRDDSRRLIAGLQQRYAGEAGVPSLKIRHNNVLGYFIEVTAAQADKLKTQFIHRQTMAGTVRFTTPELGELEAKINSAAERALARELELFEQLCQAIKESAETIAETASALAVLDVTAGLAELAVEAGYNRPSVDRSLAFEVSEGRHPVVAGALAKSGETAFVPNDCRLGEEQRIWLLTGPNMAGKSTFLRQNALIAVLAQMGSFVPAAAARIGVVDRLFSRVGAADDLARGRSTFMVEMIETAAILNQAGERALVILDEIGRGTATFDGLSIAWATLEHLHDVNRCRALFATHYHELTGLARRLDGLGCYTMRVKEWQGRVVFLHEVAPGAADRSYGIHVARLAGVPPAVLHRAEEVLALLEASDQARVAARLADDLPLFAAARPRGSAASAPSPLEQAFAEIDPDRLSPRQALETLYRLRELLAKRPP